MKKHTLGSEVGPIISWSPRKNRPVILAGSVPFWDGAHGYFDWVRCTLAIPRRGLVDHVAEQKENPLYPTLAVRCALTIWQTVKHGPLTRKRELFLEVQPGARLKFSRTAVHAFRRFFAGAPPYTAGLAEHEKEEFARGFEQKVRLLPEVYEQILSLDPTPPWQHLERLTFAFAFFLVSPPALPLIVHPPHGKAVAAFPLTARIPPVLFIYRELVRRAATDDEVNKKLVALMAPFDRDAQIVAYLERYHGQLATAVVLTHWWFRKEWQQVEHRGLLAADPRSVLRRFLYRTGRQKEFAQMLEAAAQDPSFHEDIVTGWVKEYLSPRRE